MKKCLILFHFHCLQYNPRLTICFDKKDMTSDLIMSYGTMSDFVSFALFGFTLVIKIRNSDF